MGKAEGQGIKIEGGGQRDFVSDEIRSFDFLVCSYGLNSSDRFELRENISIIRIQKPDDLCVIAAPAAVLLRSARHAVEKLPCTSQNQGGVHTWLAVGQESNLRELPRGQSVAFEHKADGWIVRGSVGQRNQVAGCILILRGNIVIVSV